MTAPANDRDVCKAEGPGGVICSLDWLHPPGQHEDEYKGRKWTETDDGDELAPESVPPGPVYATDVRGAGWIDAPQDGWTLERWHQDAIADARSSHKLVGRMYVVQCEWCPSAFIAHTKVKAMELFRAHEDLMLNPETGENDG